MKKFTPLFFLMAVVLTGWLFSLVMTKSEREVCVCNAATPQSAQDPDVRPGKFLLIDVGNETMTPQSAQDFVPPVMSEEKISDLIAGIYSARAGKFLLKEENFSEGENIPNVRVVFVHNKKRYTLDHNRWTEGIQTWVRLNGTSDHEKTAGIVDQDMDGIVEFGSDGGRTDSYIVRNFTAEKYPAQTKGSETLPHWQKLYGEALTALQAVLQD